MGEQSDCDASERKKDKFGWTRPSLPYSLRKVQQEIQNLLVKVSRQGNSVSQKQNCLTIPPQSVIRCKQPVGSMVFAETMDKQQKAAARGFGRRSSCKWKTEICILTAVKLVLIYRMHVYYGALLHQSPSFLWRA